MLKVSNLVYVIDKFAELTDELCKRILNEPKLKVILDDKGLLDEFNKSMPERPITELREEHLKNLNLLLRDMSKIEDPELEELLKQFGNLKVSETLLEFLIEKYINEFGDMKSQLDVDEVDFLLSEFTLRSLVELAVSESVPGNQVSSTLKQHLESYRDILKNPEAEDFALNSARAVQQISVDMGQLALLITSLPHTSNESKYREALSIRDSENFDFLDDDDFDIEAAFREADASISSDVQKGMEKSHEILQGPSQDVATPEEEAYAAALRQAYETREREKREQEADLRRGDEFADEDIAALPLGTARPSTPTI